MIANVTAVTVNLFFGVALILFVLVYWSRRRVVTDVVEPPPILEGKVPVWFFREKDLWVVLGIVMYFYLMGVSSALMAGKEGGRGLQMLDVILGSGLQFLVAGVAIAMVLGRVSLKEWLGLSWKGWGKGIFLVIGVTFGMWIVIGMILQAGYMDLVEKLGAGGSQETVKVFQKSPDLTLVLMMAAMAVIVAPLCEEIVFRGFIYGAAKKHVGAKVAGLASALVFAAAHGNMMSMMPLFLLGLILAWIYEETGSIWAPIGVHFLFNGASVTANLLLRYGVLELPK